MGRRRSSSWIPEGRPGGAADGSFQVEVESARYPPATFALGKERRRVESTELPLLELFPGGRIHIVVWDEKTNAPCLGCTLSIDLPGSSRRLPLMATDQDGELVTPLLEPGQYRVALDEVQSLGSMVRVRSGDNVRNAIVEPGKTASVSFGEKRGTLEVAFVPALPADWSLRVQGAFQSEGRGGPHRRRRGGGGSRSPGVPTPLGTRPARSLTAGSGKWFRCRGGRDICFLTSRMTYQAILLGIDGTLVDSNEAHIDAWAQALREAGFEVGHEQIRPLIGMGGDNLLPAAVGIDKWVTLPTMSKPPGGREWPSSPCAPAASPTTIWPVPWRSTTMPPTSWPAMTPLLWRLPLTPAPPAHNLTS